jgi:hypothetical protein
MNLKNDMHEDISFFFFFLFDFFLLHYFFENKYAMMQMMQTRLAGCVSRSTGSKLRLEFGTTNHLRPKVI